MSYVSSHFHLKFPRELVRGLFILFLGIVLNGCVEGEVQSESVIGNADQVPPTFLGLKTATLQASSGALLRWDAASDDVSESAKIFYDIFQSVASGGYDFSNPIYSTAAGATQFQVSGLAPSTTYYFVVRARDRAGNQDSNAVELSVTVAGDTSPPAFSGISSVTTMSASQLDLSWSSAMDNATPASQIYYEIYQSLTPGGQSFASPTFTTSPGALSYSVTGLSSATKYYFVVRAVDLGGSKDSNVTEKYAVTADNSPPTFAGVTSKSVISGTQINLSWMSGSDNLTPNANLVYDIYQSLSAGGQNFLSPTYTTSAGAINFSVTGLSPATQYYFVVRARDAAGNRDSNTIEIAGKTLDTIAPVFGGATSVTTPGVTTLTLNWSAATDNSDASSSLVYDIYRATATGGQNFASATYSSAAGATSFVASGLAPSTIYYFVVRARDISGNRELNTTEVSATTAPDLSPPTFAGLVSASPAGLTSLKLQWAAASDNVNAPGQIVYDIYQSSTAGGQNFASPTFTSGAGATSYVVSGLASSTPYYFVVRARDTFGNGESNVIERSGVGANIPPTFAGLSSVTTNSDVQVTLNWSPATDADTPSPSIFYRIYEATTPGGQNFAVPTYTTAAGATSYVVTITSGARLYYVVRAVDDFPSEDTNVASRLGGDGAMRLVGGMTGNEGRVEIFHANAWGTVCDDTWDNSDATVVCRALGYTGSATARSGQLNNKNYTDGAGQIWLDSTGCLGTESTLADCTSGGWGIHNCTHPEDSGVTCD